MRCSRRGRASHGASLLISVFDGPRGARLSDDEFRWLRRIGRLWILKAEMVPMLLLASMLISAVLLLLIGLSGWVAPAAAMFVCGSFGAAIVQHFLFFHAIRCPECGYNPTRSKRENKKMSVKPVWSRLRPLENCSECGK
jgi:hypothetical protein